MSFLHTPLFTEEPGAVLTSKIIDTLKSCAGSIEATVAGSSGCTWAFVVEGSSAFPPNGAIPNNSTGIGINAGWEPPAASWVQIAYGSLSADGSVLISLPETVLLTRWIRLRATPDAGGPAGTLTATVFLRIFA